jgi:hypothetical protein
MAGFCSPIFIVFFNKSTEKLSFLRFCFQKRQYFFEKIKDGVNWTFFHLKTGWYISNFLLFLDANEMPETIVCNPGIPKTGIPVNFSVNFSAC